MDDRIKKLLASGSLTGMEAGKLVIQDSWLVDRNKDGFLSERDIQALKAGLHTQKDIDDYNSCIHTYRLVDYTLKEAHILALEFQRDLLMASRVVEDYLLEDKLRGIQMLGLPAIVTQKQYDDLKDRQRAMKLQEITTLKRVLEGRAQEIARPEVEEEWMSGDEEGKVYNYFIYYLQEFHPEDWKNTISNFIDVVEKSQLYLPMASKAGQNKMERLWKKMAKVREEARDNWGGPDSPTSRKMTLLGQQEKSLLEELWKEGQGSGLSSQAELISQLQALRDGQLSEDEEYRLLEFSLCSVEQLYQAGLPEWVEDVDEYMPNLDEDTASRPKGMMQSFKVAIIQNPDPDEVDERGYYKDNNPLGKLTFLGRRSSHPKLKNMDEFLKLGDKRAKEQIKGIMAMLAIMEAVSKVMGIDFTEDMRDWYGMSETVIDMYNGMIENAPTYLGMPELKPIKIDNLKPSKSTEKYIQERLAMSLGKDWEKDVAQVIIQDMEDKEAEDAQAETA